MRDILATSLILLLVPSIVFGAEAKVPAGYEVQSISDFTVLVPGDVLKIPADRWQRKPLQVLEQDLNDLRRVIGAKHLAMVTQIPIWVNWNAIDPKAPGVVAVYYGGTGKALERIGQQPLKANCIEVLSLKRLGELRPPGSKFQQVVLLHEMAHALQHRLLGLDAAEVNSAFQQAVDRKLYDEVTDRFGQKGQAYARTSPAEYFAELSCAYLDSCHFYPFTFADLKSHDPAGFGLMESVWKRPEQFAGRNVRVETPQFSGRSVAKVVTSSGPAAEQTAFTLVDRARAQLRDGKKDEAKKLLNNVVRDYPATFAAADARKLLDTVR